MPFVHGTQPRRCCWNVLTAARNTDGGFDEANIDLTTRKVDRFISLARNDRAGPRDLRSFHFSTGRETTPAVSLKGVTCLTLLLTS